MSKAKTALAKCIGPFCTDFNTKKNYEVILRKFGKKNVFAQISICQRHCWCTLSWEYLRELSKKIWNGPNGVLRGLGETDSWKNQKSKISWHCPFQNILFLDKYNLSQSLEFYNFCFKSIVLNCVCRMWSLKILDK